MGGIMQAAYSTDSWLNEIMVVMNLPIRHALATLAYRLGKVLRDTPAEFGDFQTAYSTRTPGQILAHIGDLLDWALATIEGRKEWHNAAPLPWNQEIARFYAALKSLDQRIETHGLGELSAEKLFQAPIADALTHTGQIALLRRMAGIPIRPEDYLAAEMTVGRVGSEQAPPRLEFD
jgi:hypothetical protein